jgi:hypothetical protein
VKTNILVVAALAALFAACSGSNAGNVFGDPNGTGDGGPGGSSSGSGGPGNDGGSCVPQCNGKTCGDDGCGGSCGACGAYQRCDDAKGACVAACDLTPLEGSKKIDLNLGVANVAGHVTWNGGAPPVVASLRVYFFDKKANAASRTTLGASYATRLYASTYSIGVDATYTDAPGVPQQLVILKDDVAISGDTTIDLSISTATLSGVVTIDGLEPPAGTRGRVVLRGAGGSSSVAVATSGSATYTTPVFSGTYDVAFDSTNANVALPYQSAVVKKGVAINAMTSLDLALATATLSGTVTANGAELPAENNRGRIVLRSADTTPAMATVASSAAATFSVKAYAGTYDIAFDSEGASTLPAQTTTLTKGKALSGTSQSNFDLKVVNLAGNVTLNGAPLPADTSSRGSVELVLLEGGSTVLAPLGSTGSTFAARVYAGTYDVRVDSSSSQNVLPPQRASVKRGVSVTASGPLDLDLHTAHVQGSITLDGAPLPNQSPNSGALVFVERTTGDRFELPVTSPNYQAVVYTGTYGVEFGSSTNAANLPQQSTHVLDQKITGDASVDVPLKSLTVQGSVTVNGADMPTASASRGRVVFADKLTGSRVDFALGAAGPASYTLLLFDGGYDVRFESGTSQTVLPDGEERVLSGCIPVNTACALSDKDLGGSWLLDFSGWGTMQLTLTQSGTALGGYADSSWGAGPLTSGTRTSSSVHFVADTSGIDIDTHGDIANGCVMSGSAIASTGYTADWVGQRLE